MTPQKKMKHRHSNMLSTRRWRARVDGRPTATVDEEATPMQVKMAFKSRSAYCKAKMRATRALPSSPTKCQAIVRGLAKNILNIDIPSSERKAPSALSISEETSRKVEAFFNNDAISRVMPGKADFIIIRSSDGTKHHVQKRHMIMTLAESYKLFIEDNPNNKIGKSKFAEMRPDHVLLVSQTPHNVCGCIYHSNIILLCEGIHRKEASFPLYNKREFFSMAVCSSDNEDCMSNNCETCADGKLLDNVKENMNNIEENIPYYQWKNDEEGFCIKDLAMGKIKDVIEILKGQLPKFCWHVFIKEKQSQSYDEHKADACLPDSETVLIQTDFSQNYTSVYQDEVQKVHWRRKTMTVFTVTFWHRDHIGSIVLISDVLEHDKTFVSALL